MSLMFSVGGRRHRLLARYIVFPPCHVRRSYTLSEEVPVLVWIHSSLRCPDRMMCMLSVMPKVDTLDLTLVRDNLRTAIIIQFIHKLVFAQNFELAETRSHGIF